ncbi:hypothetical protein FRC20_004683, partial [Serendipita sp. 405]
MQSLISILLSAAAAGTLFATVAVNAAPILPNGNWAPAEGGCWTDNVGHQRALDRNMGGTGDMTPAKCQNLCEAEGFSLAGVEYGRECFCGNAIFGNNRPSSDGICNMPCSGDTNQMCGGPDAINIYVKNSFQYTTGPASPLPSYKTFTNPRCWRDSSSSRIFTAGPSQPIPANEMTVQKCIDGCAVLGYESAGLEYGRECYCGYAFTPLADMTDINECNMPCLGDASEFCGGPDRLLIYHKPKHPGEPIPNQQWTPVQGGCWTDNVGGQRALEHFYAGLDDLSPGWCQVLCEWGGFALSGLEFSRECWCGNTIMGNNRPSSDGICNMPCTGSPGKVCGGRDAINIYVSNNLPYTVGPASVLESYKGYSKTQCWQDLTTNRILKHGPARDISGDSMTVQKCIEGCNQAGYSSAGLEYGRECYCDNVNYPPGQSESMSECDMPCTGDATQICGGSNRMLIYHNPTGAITYRGIVEVWNTEDRVLLGYLSKNTAYYGRAIYEPNEADAEVITFQIPLGPNFVRKGEIFRTSVPSGSGLSILGLLQAFPNNNSILGSGSYNHLYIAGTGHTEPGAVPTIGPNAYTAETGLPRTIESSIWTINIPTADIVPTWINPDGGIPNSQIELFACGIM